MEACKENCLQMLIDFLDEAEARDVELSAMALEPLLGTFKIEPGSTDHFVLVWSDFLTKKKLGKPFDFQAYEKRFPHWKGKFSGLLQLEKMMGTLQERSLAKFKELLCKQSWDLISVLNHSSRFVTCLVQRQNLQSPVVVKLGNGQGAKRQLEKEFNLGSMMDGRGFVKYMGYGATDGMAWVATEYASLGSLEFREGITDPEKIWKWWIQIANALANLHEKNYCHNDLKASNLLLTMGLNGEERVVLADLQHATKIGRPVRRLEDKWDHPDWTLDTAARRGDDVYRLATTIAWLLDPDFCKPGMRDNDSRLAYLNRLPERFRFPLEKCFLDRYRDRIENAMELERMLLAS